MYYRDVVLLKVLEDWIYDGRIFSFTYFLPLAILYPYVYFFKFINGGIDREKMEKYNGIMVDRNFITTFETVQKLRMSEQKEKFYDIYESYEKSLSEENLALLHKIFSFLVGNFKSSKYFIMETLAFYHTHYAVQYLGIPAPQKIRAYMVREGMKFFREMETERIKQYKYLLKTLLSGLELPPS